MTFHKTFYDYLTDQSLRLDMVGALARDVRRDYHFPQDTPGANAKQSYRKCRLYLAVMVGECSPAIDALERAMGEHQAFLEKTV